MSACVGDKYPGEYVIWRSRIIYRFELKKTQKNNTYIFLNNFFI